MFLRILSLYVKFILWMKASFIYLFYFAVDLFKGSLSDSFLFSKFHFSFYLQNGVQTLQFHFQKISNSIDIGVFGLRNVLMFWSLFGSQIRLNMPCLKQLSRSWVSLGVWAYIFLFETYLGSRFVPILPACWSSCGECSYPYFFTPICLLGCLSLV